MRWILIFSLASASFAFADEWTAEEAGKHLSAMENLVAFLCPTADSNLKVSMCLENAPNHSIYFAACGSAFEDGPKRADCYERVLNIWSDDALREFRPELIPPQD